MRKLLLILLMIAVMAGNCFGATYYVSNTGTAKGGTACATFLAMAANESTPAKTVADMNTCQASLSDGDIIAFKRGDVWAEQLINAHANITFTAYGTGVTPPKFTGATYSIRSNVAGQKFQNLWTDGLPIYFSSTASGTQMEYCLITTSGNYAGAIQAFGTTANIYNNTIKSRTPGIYVNNAAADVQVKNNLLLGGGNEAARFVKANGSCTLQNNMVFGSNAYPSQYTPNSGCTDGGGNIGISWADDNGISDVPASSPVIGDSYPNPKVVIVRDDRQNVAAWLADIAAVQALGITGYKETVADFAYDTQTYSAGELTAIRAAIDAGHEVVLHSATGSNVGHTTPYTAFTISTTNGGTNTLTIDASGAKTLTLTSSGNPENNISIDWSAARKAACDLRAAMGQSTCSTANYTGKGWTITNNSQVSPSLGLSSLADLSCSSFPCTVALDKNTATNRFFYDEIVAGKSALETLLDRPVYSFMYHQGGDAASKTYVKESGLYKGQRAGNFAGSNAYLDSLDIWDVYAIPSQALAQTAAATEAMVRANTRTVYGWAKFSRAAICTYFHTTAYITSEQVGWIADEFSKLGAEFMTFSELMDWVKADHTTADGYIYTKTFTDTSADYAIPSASPAKNAGVLVTGVHDQPGVTDYAGNSVYNRGGIDIGAFEYMWNDTKYRSKYKRFRK